MEELAVFILPLWEEGPPVIERVKVAAGAIQPHLKVSTRGGSGSKLAHAVAGRINVFAGCCTEGLTQFLATWTSPQESSQHSGWLPSEPMGK